MTEGAVLFADLLMDPLYDEIGEQAAAALIDNAMQAVAKGIQICNGRVLKKIGTEVMAVFPDAAAAADGAIAMQRSVAALSLAWPWRSRTRIGFAWGPVVEKDGELFGDTVSVASRAAHVAAKRQIVLSGDAVASLNPDQREACMLLCTIALKGKNAEIELFELPWE